MLGNAKPRFVLDAVLIVGFVLFLGFLLDAWVYSPYPLGYDTLKHLYKTKLVLDYWPYIRWDHHWAAGMPMFKVYVPFPYFLIATIVQITGLSIEFTLVSLIAVSYCLMGVGFYLFMYEVTKSRGVSLASSLLLASTPSLWQLHIESGVWTRVTALMFFSFALWVSARFANKPSNAGYAHTILLLTAANLFHPAIGFLASSTILLIFLFYLRGWRQKVCTILKVGVPAFLLNSYYLAPLIFSPLPGYDPVNSLTAVLTYRRQGLTSIRPMDFLFRLPESGVDLALPALTWPLTAFLSLAAIFLVVRFRKSVKNGFLKVLIVLTCLSAVFIQLNYIHEMSWYGFSLLPFYLISLDGIVLSQMYEGIRKYWDKIPTLISVSLICLIVVSTMLVPHVHTVPLRPDLKPLVSPLTIPARESMFRVGISAEQGEMGMWFNYIYDVPQTRDYAIIAYLYGSWPEWLQNVWFKMDNYNETDFLLDWWGIKWILASDTRIPGTSISQKEKFLKYPDHYELTAEAGDLGVHEYTYYNATPILSASNVPSLLLVGNDIAYNTIFRGLSFSDYDSRYVVPVRGHEYVDDHTLDEMSRFDAIILYGYSYRDRNKAWDLLRQYVENGGGLIIETGYSPDSKSSHIPLPCPVEATNSTRFGEEWDLTLNSSPVTRGIDFSSFSPAIDIVDGTPWPWGVSASYNGSVRSWADVVVWEAGHPIVAMGEQGRGRVIWSGMNLPYHVLGYHNSVESLFLSRIIDWASRGSEKRAVKVDYAADRPNPERVTVTVNNACGGVLFKEFFYQNWYAYLVDADNVRHGLTIYRAGPDFMYVRVPAKVSFPVKVFFEYGVTWDEWIGYSTSLVALVMIVLYGFAPRVFDRVSSPSRILVNRVKKAIQRARGWWYKEE